MRILLVLCVVVVASEAVNQTSLFQRKKEALTKLLKTDIMGFIKENRDTILEVGLNPLNSFSLIRTVKDAITDIAKMLKNTAFTFTAGLYGFALWPVNMLMGRNSIRGGGTRRDFTNSSWNYTYANYVEKGWVSPVKNQGKCGSCYAFGSVAAVEAQYLKNGESKLFSEQQLVDCTNRKYKGPMNLGCTSGTAMFSMQYMNESAVVSPSEYPYTAKEGRCQSNKPKERDLNFLEILPDNEDHLAYLLNKNGPFTVYIYAGRSFSYYKEGIFNDPGCTERVNHAVLLSGIGEEDGEEYWLLKNSWGPSWGENGYIRFAKGKNMCNIISNNVTIASLGEIITQ